MTVQDVIKRKQMQRSAAYSRAAELTRQLHDELPQIAAIDAELGAFPQKLLLLPKGAGRQAALDALKAEVKSLGERRKEILAVNGYPTDYDAVKYECPICQDTGYSQSGVCECVRKEIASYLYGNGGIGKALLGKGFDNLSLDYYTGEAKQTMASVFEICRNFATGFEADGRSLLLLGGTGLGKTHVSAAIAKEVIAKGFTAYYETAPAMFDAYDAVRFGRKDQSVLEPYDSTLLVIDDLGSEANSASNTSVLFEIINRRFLQGLSTVISTNLSPAEIKKRYNDRVYSRLLGEYTVVQFVGTDVRLQKLKNRV